MGGLVAPGASRSATLGVRLPGVAMYPLHRNAQTPGDHQSWLSDEPNGESANRSTAEGPIRALSVGGRIPLAKDIRPFTFTGAWNNRN